MLLSLFFLQLLLMSFSLLLCRRRSGRRSSIEDLDLPTFKPYPVLVQQERDLELRVGPRGHGLDPVGRRQPVEDQHAVLGGAHPLVDKEGALLVSFLPNLCFVRVQRHLRERKRGVRRNPAQKNQPRSPKTTCEAEALIDSMYGSILFKAAKFILVSLGSIAANDRRRAHRIKTFNKLLRKFISSTGNSDL